MRRLSLCLAVLACLVVGSEANVASAQDPCCRRPVLRAAAFLVRGTVRLVTAPFRLLAHHHHGCGCYDCGCGYDGYGYGYDAGWDYGQAGGYESFGPVPSEVVYSAPFAAPLPTVMAVYEPIVAADAIDGMTAEACRAAAARAMSEGVNHYRRGEIEVARQYFDESIQLMPDMAAAWGLRGVAAAAANDEEVAAECALQVRLITADNAAERSHLYRTLSPVQGQSRVQFEQLVRHVDSRQSVENLAGNP